MQTEVTSQDLQQSPGVFGRTLAKVALYFYYTASPALLNPLHYLRAWSRQRGEAKIRSIDDGALYAYLRDIVEKSGSTGCDFSDYWTIYSTLQELQPKAVLECGSGVSSVVFAYYAAQHANDGAAPKVVSVEESEHYHQNIVSIFPAELKPHIEFVRRDRVEALYGERRGCYYRDVPELQYEFVFIDGPVDRRVFLDKSLPKCFNADFINVVRRVDHPVSALLDQRIFTLRALRALIRSRDISYLPTRSMAFLSNITRRDLVDVDVVELD
jgi:hypothetical protein